MHARLTGRAPPQAQFRTPLLCRHVRHPLYLGLLLGLWSAPVMTGGHLLFAAVTSAYIVVGIGFEERDLVAQFGERYLRYRAEVGMLVPRWRRYRQPMRRVGSTPPESGSASACDLRFRLLGTRHEEAAHYRRQQDQRDDCQRDRHRNLVRVEQQHLHADEH